jgi:hypothetical protein
VHRLTRGKTQSKAFTVIMASQTLRHFVMRKSIAEASQTLRHFVMRKSIAEASQILVELLAAQISGRMIASQRQAAGDLN